jgi:hypothetical protein
MLIDSLAFLYNFLDASELVFLNIDFEIKLQLSTIQQ